MERFPTLTTCPECGHASPLLYGLSAAGYTRCDRSACNVVYKLRAEALEGLARVALLNLPGARALALLAEARDVLGLAAPTVEARGIAPADAEAGACVECEGPRTLTDTDEDADGDGLCGDCRRIERAALRSRGER